MPEADGPWLVLQLAGHCLESGTLRPYWAGLHRYGVRRDLLVRVLATCVWLALVPIVPIAAARRRRLIGRALEGVVRAISAGVAVDVALARGVEWLARRGVARDGARSELERILAGFVSPSAAPPTAERARSRAS
jgi:hypothetical protein